MGLTREKHIIYQEKLIEELTQGTVTNWMETNAGQIRYMGGMTVKIPKIAVTGLEDYNDGYPVGDFSKTYEEFTMTQDRGTSLYIDSRETDEEHYVPDLLKLAKTFQETQVIPELDAYRISKLYANAGSKKEGYTPTKDTILTELLTGIQTLRKNQTKDEIIIYCSYGTMQAIQEATTGLLREKTYKVGSLEYRVPEINGCALIEVVDERLYTSVDLTTGCTKGADAKTLNFIMTSKSTPIAVKKLDDLIFFTPQQNINKHGYTLVYRLHHDLWVLEDRKKTIYANVGN